jgi:hypothetical protein
LLTSGVAVTLEALKVGIHLSEAAASGSKLGAAEQQSAENVLHIPAVAQVICRWQDRLSDNRDL